MIYHDQGIQSYLFLLQALSVGKPRPLNAAGDQGQQTAAPAT